MGSLCCVRLTRALLLRLTAESDNERLRESQLPQSLLHGACPHIHPPSIRAEKEPETRLEERDNNVVNMLRYSQWRLVSRFGS